MNCGRPRTAAAAAIAPRRKPRSPWHDLRKRHVTAPSATGPGTPCRRHAIGAIGMSALQARHTNLTKIPPNQTGRRNSTRLAGGKASHLASRTTISPCRRLLSCAPACSGGPLQGWLANTPPFRQAWCKMHPGLGLLRFAALLSDGAEADDDTLDAMFRADGNRRAGPACRLKRCGRNWPRVSWARSRPPCCGRFGRAACWKSCCRKSIALFGVPQIADDPGEVDLGDPAAALARRGGAPERPAGGALRPAHHECGQVRFPA